MPRKRFGLTIATAVLVLSGYASLATVYGIGVQIMLIPFAIACIAPLGIWLDGRYPLYRKCTTAMSLFFLLMLPVAAQALGLLAAVTVLVIYIQTYELSHRKEIRNYYYIYLMSFFLLLSACAQNPDAGIAPVIGLFLISAVWAFFLLQIEAAMGGTVALAPPDIVPLDAKHAYGHHSNQRSLRASVAVSALMMSVASVLLTAVLFMATPRMEAGLFGRESGARAQIQNIGLSDSVNFSQGGSLIGDGTPVMQVRFPRKPEGAYDGPLLWRSHALNRYTGSSFEPFIVPAFWRNDPTPKFHPDTQVDGGLFRFPMHNDSRFVYYEIFMGYPPQQLPTLGVPIRAATDDARLSWAKGLDGEIRLVPMTRAGFEAQVWSEIHDPTPEELRAAPDNYREVIRLNAMMELTRQDLRPESRQLVRNLTANAPTVYDKVIAIQNYFSSQDFVYTNNLPVLPPENSIDEFLWQTRTGHCQLFASAMTLMVRSLNIPARVVTGYRGGVWSNTDSAYVVTSDMAHTWVEVYFLGEGWVPFDPSPGGEEDNSIGGIIANTLSRLSLGSKIFWYRNVVGYQSVFRLENLQKFGIGLFSAPFQRDDPETPADAANSGRPLPIVWLAMLVICALILVQSMRNRRMAAAPAAVLSADQVRAQKLFQQLRRSMNRAGVETINSSASDLLAMADDATDAGALNEIVEAYNQARFGLRPLPADRYRDLAQRAKSIAKRKK